MVFLVLSHTRPTKNQTEIKTEREWNILYPPPDPIVSWKDRTRRLIGVTLQRLRVSLSSLQVCDLDFELFFCLFKG